MNAESQKSSSAGSIISSKLKSPTTNGWYKIKMKKTQLVIIGALASMPLFSGCDTIGDSVDMMRDSLQKNIDPQWLGRTNYNTVVVTTVVVTNVVTVTNVVVKPSAVQSTTPH